jgi:hypothetical protein
MTESGVECARAEQRLFLAQIHGPKCCSPARLAAIAAGFTGPLALQRVVLDRHVLALDVAGFTKPLAGRGHIARYCIGRPGVDEPDHRQRWLLRPRRKRPRRRRASKSRNEVAPPHRSCLQPLQRRNIPAEDTLERTTSRVALGRSDCRAGGEARGGTLHWGGPRQRRPR